MRTSADSNIGCFGLLYSRYALESPARNERTGSAVDGGGPFQHKLVQQINPNQTCFHDMRSHNQRNRTPPLRSIVFVRVVRRLQDLLYRTAARRQALSGGRGLRATLSCAQRVYTPVYTALATSLGTRIPCTRGCWDARCDVL